jgi:nucleoside-diphosphate-sugar epimerase
MPQQQDAHADTVLVTGATGRLGRAVVKELVASGSMVRALMMKNEDVKLLAPGTVPFIGHLNETQVLHEACKGADVVFHFAGIVNSSASTAEEMMGVNVEGTKHVLEACIKNKVKHFIFSSSVDVYGRTRKGTLNEESQLMPTDKYGHSKMLAEQEIMKSGVPYTILRMANIYGPGFEYSFFKVFRAVKEGKMVIIGSGRNHMTLVHISDVVRAFMLVKQNPEVSIGKVYNLSDGNIYTQEGLVNFAAELLNAQKPKSHVQEFLVRMLARSRNLDSDELRFLTSDRIIDISRIKKDLGFVPQTDLRTGGKEAVSDFLNKSRMK